MRGAMNLLDEIGSALTTDRVPARSTLYSDFVGAHHWQVTRREYLLIASLVAASFALTLVWVRFAGESGQGTDAASLPTPSAAAAESASPSPPANVPAARWRANPAAQKAGPPDQRAQRSATAGAENAAQAAAELADTMR
jgi:hypothetical protein